jgi:hypothetical protein
MTGLVVDLLAALRDVGPGDEHARVDAVVVLAADLRVVVVHVLKDVLEADALGWRTMRTLFMGVSSLELLLQEPEQLLQGFQLPDGFLLGQAGLAGDVSPSLASA